MVSLSFTAVGGHMTPEMIYVTLGLYHAIRNATALFLPFAMAFMMEASVSLTRLKVSNQNIVYCEKILKLGMLKKSL